ncbi:MAG: tRNA (5-methylaminomethyl-2-thiouridine)(34)-methyltransferase MnmD [Muribaculaceae bacterium]|nr:tRNA (5-methylaminomethyl-2-thiouridine)(34)-methyltransferase MnmD [Muribaculaceae bacterium]
MKAVIETTADRSATIYLPALNEHYHSVKGALAEALHVYIGNGWRHAADRGVAPVRVVEAGLGTGLNAALTAMEAARRGVPTAYRALELYPLDTETFEQWVDTIDPATVDLATLRAIADAPWEVPVEINPCFTVVKCRVDMTAPGAFGPDGSADVVYFDAFAPEVQPALWTPEMMARVADVLAPGGAVVTYCAKGAVRRALAAAGLTTERLPGPPGGKREVLRAVAFQSRLRD